MRSTRLAAILGIVVAVCCSCSGGPSDRPNVAVEVEHHGGRGEPTTTKPEDQIPQLQAPKGDIDWRECTGAMINLFGLAPGPPGLVFDCGEFSAPIDAAGNIYGTFTVGALRARLPQTPTDALPLVLTSGSDRSSSGTLAALATGPGSAILPTRPIVAVDRRGIGNSQPIECMAADTRRGLADLGQFSTGEGDAADRVAELSEAATIACKDFLQPQELAFDTAHAADDIEQLRLIWQVDSLALLGTGNGARVALSYAAKYPAQVGRLILDGPEGLGLDGQTLAANRLQGAEAALTAFATRCVGLQCSLGPDPRAAVADLVGKARRGELPGVSANSLLTAIAGFLGSPRSDQPSRVAVLADALSTAGRGDLTQLNAIVLREEATTGSDGQFINRCSDTLQWPTPPQVRNLQTEWAQTYPVFGVEGATSLLVCSAWPVGSGTNPPTDLKIPVLALSTAADPVVGDAGLGPITGAIGNAGGKASAITWQGWGHPVFAHSGCAQTAIVKYLDTGELPENGTVCPA